jgi:hypothetical protein
MGARVAMVTATRLQPKWLQLAGTGRYDGSGDWLGSAGIPGFAVRDGTRR